jgi:hypothetical protein
MVDIVVNLLQRGKRKWRNHFLARKRSLLVYRCGRKRRKTRWEETDRFLPYPSGSHAPAARARRRSLFVSCYFSLAALVDGPRKFHIWLVLRRMEGQPPPAPAVEPASPEREVPGAVPPRASALGSQQRAAVRRSFQLFRFVRIASCSNLSQALQCLDFCFVPLRVVSSIFSV